MLCSSSSLSAVTIKIESVASNEKKIFLNENHIQCEYDPKTHVVNVFYGHVSDEICGERAAQAMREQLRRFELLRTTGVFIRESICRIPIYI